MKKNFALSSVVLLTAFILSLPLYLSAMPALAQQDVAEHPSCPLCGMDRAKFAHSRMYVLYDDGSTYGTCSLHCAAMDMALKIDKSVNSIMVGEYSSGNLIDAETAHWVIGGDKMGVMTTRAKWAFETKEGADAFVKEHGGQIGTFDEAISGAFQDMYKDTKMIREKRQKMRKGQSQS